MGNLNLPQQPRPQASQPLEDLNSKFWGKPIWTPYKYLQDELARYNQAFKLIRSATIVRQKMIESLSKEGKKQVDQNPEDLQMELQRTFVELKRKIRFIESHYGVKAEFGFNDTTGELWIVDMFATGMQNQHQNIVHQQLLEHERQVIAEKKDAKR